MKSSLGSLGKKMSSAASSAASSARDATVMSPTIEELGAEQRYDIETDVVQPTKKCYVYVSCEVGKQIRDKLKEHLESAAKEYNESFGKLEEPTGSIANLQKFSAGADAKIKAIQMAKAEYEKKRATAIVLNPHLECKLSIKGTVDNSGNKLDKEKVDGKIIEIDPKGQTLKVEAIGHVKTSKGIEERKVKMSSTSISKTLDINIKNLCVGGATADDNNQGQCFAQTGGNKRSMKAEILTISSDMGICE